MEKTAKTTYSTAKLKRYPAALCKGLAFIAKVYANKVVYEYSPKDPVRQVALSLKAIYDASDDAMDDGDDFAGTEIN